MMAAERGNLYFMFLWLPLSEVAASATGFLGFVYTGHHNSDGAVMGRMAKFHQQ